MSTEAALRPDRVLRTSLVLETSATLAAALGLVFGLAGNLLAAILLSALGLLAVAALLIWTARRDDTGTVLAIAPVSRSALAIAVAVTIRVATATTAAAWWAGIALGLLLLVIVVEPQLRRAAVFTARFVSHLPGVPPAPPSRSLSGLVVGSSLSAVALGLIVALGLPAWLWTLIAGMALIPALASALDGRRKILYTRRIRAIVPDALAEYGPEFIVYTSRPDDASYQVAMWLPYLERTGCRFAIVTRDRVPAEALAARTEAPVIEAHRIADLDPLVVPSLRAAFYVNASSGNGAFVRYHQLTHVYLGHGDSEKPPSYNPTHAMYDQVFVAGPAAPRRYPAHGVHIPAEKFRVVGRPQAEDVQRADRQIGDVAEPVVLYAPTWKGHVEETMLYSLPVGERIVQALLARGAVVVFRPHPFSYEDPVDAATIARIHELLAAEAARTGREHRWGAAAEKDLGILDCMNVSDAMVTDVSSVVSDYLFSGKPFAMIAVPADPDPFRVEYPVARASYVVRGDLADLEPTLDQMLGPDPLAEQRAAIRSDYLGDFPAETYADAFVAAVRDVATHRGAGTRSTDDEEDRDAAESESESGNGGAEADASAGETARMSLLSRVAGYRQALETIVATLVGTALAVLALLLALLGAPAWGAVLVGLAGFAIGVWAYRKVLRDRTRWERLLGQLGVARALLIAVLAVIGAATGGGITVLGVTVVLLLLTLVGESFIGQGWARIGLEVRDFPEVDADVDEWLPRGVVPFAGTAALLLGLLLTALGLPVIVTGVLALIAFVIFVDALTRALVRARRVVDADERLSAALRAFAPEFVVYFSSTVGAAYQIGMWLPYFERIGRRYVIVTRTVAMLREAAQVTATAGVRVPIIFRPTLRSVEEIVVPSLTTAFYVNNAARNTHLVERRELTHVWLNHGDSEKPACYNPVHAIYDLLFAAGQAGIDRYARHGVSIPTEKFRIVGRPQVEAITPAAGPVAAALPPTVLYAPTWQGPFSDSRVFSLPIGRQIVEALLARGARVIFRAHPFNYRYSDCRDMIADIGRLLAADQARTGRDHRWGPAAEQAMSVEDCFNASDAMICDISAVASDYLRSDKPFAMVSVGRTPEQLLIDAPAAQASYVLHEDLGNLNQVLDDLLLADPLARERARTRIYYLGDFGEPYAEGFLAAARAVIDRQDPMPTDG